MKLKYITNIRIPTEKAHGIQVMKMCEKFSKLVEVELIVPNKTNYLNRDPFDYYRIEKIFSIIKVPSIDFGGKTSFFPRFLFILDFFIFAFSVFFSGKVKKEDTVYTRDYLLLPFLFAKKRVVEIHDIPSERFFFPRIIKKADLIVAITLGIKKELISIGVPDERIVVSPDGVDVESFNFPITKQEARNKLSLPLNKNIVLYSGQLYSWKGADILAKASKYLDDNFLTVFVGGTLPWLSKFQEEYNYKNILILPMQNRELVPIFLKSADILIIPNTGKQKISSLYTSPLKLFEYMASNRPIIASDIPSLREILNENNAIFFESDNEKSLAEKINLTMNALPDSDKKANQALKDVYKYTWDKRAENIIKAIF
jgi:glycosyltransferase involved in cell wall biosynthesis